MAEAQFAGPEAGAAAEAQRRMDRMYRYQRFIYDLTRKFYLIGRDGLLSALPREAGATICEMGCGTGRNLIRLARMAPETRLYGIDVSLQMLATAQRSIVKAGLAERIQLAHSGVENLDSEARFGVGSFDAVYFSYVLSMIPDWRPAILRALELLRPGGVLGIVDFADQSAASPLRRHALLAWLRLFDVHPRPEIELELCRLADASHSLARHSSIGSGYAYQLLLRRGEGPVAMRFDCK